MKRDLAYSDKVITDEKGQIIGIGTDSTEKDIYFLGTDKDGKMNTQNKNKLLSVINSSRTLVSGEKTSINFLSRLVISGSGDLSIDSFDSSDSVSLDVFSGSYSGAVKHIEFPYYGDSAVQIRATFPATLTVEVL